ncbi:LytR/AlgR family response regulator transcription factor [Dyadobacter tibetensis]|uniref:LytR/AlgR family response regulator transcription factor n=1 Tax=Dyadobacter tibetensis TaxID=1211851 RepID=UPI00047216EF|nr:response regulator transcription factor [Dyadobacter tibetensis]
MKIRTLLVDDEPHALEVLSNYLQNFPDIIVAGKCSTAIQAFQLLQQEKIDLMFLDIKMPGLTGTELIRSLKNPPKVIFTTAYQDYALDGFELNAVDYLLKPIPFDRFLRAIDKVFHILQIATPATETTDIPKSQDRDIFLYLKVDRKLVKVNVKEIYWIESIRDYVKVITKEKVLITKQKISVLEALLPEDDFIRVHRSFIVSISKIQAYHSHAVDILGQEIPIGRNYKADCQRRLKLAY